MRRALAAIVFAIVASPALADPCSKPDVERTGAAVEAARTAILDSLPKRDLDPRIPSRSRKAIAAMQHRLHAYLAAALGCSADAKALEKTLRWSTPGLRFEARSPREGLMAVTAGFDVGCGGDTVLAIFARRDGGWRDVLYAHSKPYKEVSGAWGAFDYAVSAPDEGGQWFVAAKTVAPWCSSTWSTIRYSVLRPGAAAAIFAAEDSIWWGNDDFGRLKAGRDDFELRFHAESIDGGVHNREWVRHFAVRGDKVARIAPFADTPRDFVEEWIQSSWQDAAGWTAPALAPQVKAVHARFHAEPHGEYQSIRRCGEGAEQIEIQPTAADGSLFFEVSGSRDFVLTGLSNTADPRCAGKDLYDPDKPG